MIQATMERYLQHNKKAPLYFIFFFVPISCQPITSTLIKFERAFCNLLDAILDGNILHNIICMDVTIAYAMMGFLWRV